jgi:lipoate-protein ligase A
MQLLPVTLSSLHDNLALDEALLLEAEAGRYQETLRLWEWPTPAVVLGTAGRLALEVDEVNCARNGVPVLRRSSGGGTVLLGPGCLLFSLVLSYDRAEELTQIRSSYRYILGKICQALTPFAREIAMAGTSDLAIGERKVSGNSQQRKRTHLLHHGTMLYRFDAAQVERYLLLPARQPDYRRGRDHASFLANIPLDRDALELSLRTCWEAEAECRTWPADRVNELVEKKYAQDAWIRCR